MGRFDEKIMLVTGATSGIGRAVAIRAAKEGATAVSYTHLTLPTILLV
mgnify:CR=1 FL=1